MSELIHFEYAPPRSWEQFEELCADLFEAAWSDPTLVRNGRSGQRQHGVDIIASRGAIYPVGIQCKKKSTWPLKEIKFHDIEKEVNEADKFSPSLKEFYVLTTATNDAKLLAQVRKFNTARTKDKKFTVEIIFWPEIVRKIASHSSVAKKHFPIAGSEGTFSPLLASWHPKSGKIDIDHKEWVIETSELGENFYDHPNGHIIIRQQETEKMISDLQAYNRNSTDLQGRRKILSLRRGLRYARNRENDLQNCIRALYLNKTFAEYLRDISDSGVETADILRSLIEVSLEPPNGELYCAKVRLTPPEKFQPGNIFRPDSSVFESFKIHVTSEHVSELHKTEREFLKRYKNEMPNLVSELPSIIRDKNAIPQIIRRAWRTINEENLQFDDLVRCGYLDPWQWKFRLY
ncbi:restriction endonuclease [Pseudomonas sp. MPC6]|uniref:restriction endonuclease n=1 Tax=unclassified Pseudomonas TaxID=196821 RepID=UPI0011103D4C|nr:restriction endonuclease [Pseudomonas sp. MPC6]QCY14138.1 hypothetical protein ELQ88_27025 [Pseudomonas sp. MPC6]